MLYFEPSRYSYIEVSNSKDLNITDEFTIFARICMHGWGQGLRDIVVKAPSTSWPTTNFRFGVSGWKPWALMFVHGDGKSYESWTSKSLEPFKWYDVAVTNDGIYIDGELGTPIDITLDWYPNDAPIRIGMCTGGAQKNVFYGKMCNVVMFNRKLSATEINELRKGNINTNNDSLLFWYPMNENMGVVARDYSRNNNHARLYNCKWVSRARRGMYFDNGGIKFDSGLNIDCNYCSVVAVFAIETLNKGGSAWYGQNTIVRFSNDRLSIFNASTDSKIRFTNYDTGWKEITSNIELEAGKVYTVVGIVNNNEEHLYVASNGVIIDHDSRDDLGDCGNYVDTPVHIGSGSALDQYNLHGEVLAVMIYNRPITEDEIKQISDFGWFDPPRDGLISWILFDGLKEGDTVIDKITGAVGEPIGTPKFVIRKPKRVLTI